MRKAVVLLSVVFSLLTFFPQVFAQTLDRRTGFGLGVRSGFLDIVDSGLRGADVEVDATPALGVTGTLNLNRYFSIEAAVDHAFEKEVKLKTQTTRLDFGDFSQTSVTLGLRVHIPAGGSFKLYLGGGAGYFFNDFTVRPTITSTLPGTMAEIDDDVGYFANVGAEFLITRNMALCLDVRGVWIETDARINVPGVGVASEDVDFVGVMGTLGLKYYF